MSQNEWEKIRRKVMDQRAKNSTSSSASSAPVVSTRTQPGKSAGAGSAEWAKIKSKVMDQRAKNPQVPQVNDATHSPGISSRDDWYRVYRGRVGNQQAKYNKLKTLLDTMDDYDIADSDKVKKDLTDQLSAIESSPEYVNASYAKKYAGKTSAQMGTIAKQATDPGEKSWLEYVSKATESDEDRKFRIARNTDEKRRLEAMMAEAPDTGSFLKSVYTSTPAAAGTQDAKKKDEIAKKYGYSSWKEATDRYDAIEREMYFDQNARKYDAVKTEADFAGKSQYDESKGKGVEAGEHAQYNRLNQADMKGAQVGPNLLRDKYDYMTEEDLATYNYIYNTEGKEAAEDYLDYMSYHYNELRQYGIQQDVSNWMDKGLGDTWIGGALASNASVPLKLASGIAMVDVAGQKLRNKLTGEDRPIDFNTGAWTARSLANGLREGTAQNLNEMSGTIQLDETRNPVFAALLNGKGLGDVYSLGMSMADSGVVAALSPIIGPTGVALLATSAGADGIQTALDNGATDDQAITMGVINAAAEALFEKVSLDNLIKSDPKKLLTAMLQQGGVEASEEASTSIANLIGDYIVMAEKSEWKKDIAEYMNAGDDVKTASWKAFWGNVADIAMDAIGGFITGGLMGGGSTMVQNAQARMQYGNQVGALLEDAASYGVDTKATQKAQKRMEAEKPISGSTIRQVMSQTEDAKVAQADSYANEAAQMLAEYGQEVDVTETAQAIGKAMAGQELTKEELATIERSDMAPIVLVEMQIQHAIESTTEQETSPDTSTQPATEAAQEAQEAQISEAVQVEGETEKVAPVANLPKETDAEAIANEEATEAAYQAEVMEEDVADIDAFASQYANPAAYKATFQGNQDPTQYDVAYRAAYEMGMNSEPVTQMKQSKSVQYLTPDQQIDAYREGEAAAKAQAESADAFLRSKGQRTGERKRGNVKAIGGVNVKTLTAKFNDSQRKAYRILDRIAEVTGINIVLYESKVGESGQFEGEQGRFKRSTPDTIYIDINAGLSGVSDVGNMAKYTMLATFSHEFIHFCETWNPIRYNELRKLVFETMAKKGVSVEDRIDSLMKEDSTLTRDAASREVVAEAMVDILPDANFIETLATKHQSLFQKLVERLKEFLASIRDLFNGMEKSEYASVLKEELDGTVRYMESIVTLFDNVAVEAVETMQESAMESFVEYDAATKSVAPATQYSRRTWNESTYVKDKEAAVVAISLQLGVSREQARQYIDDIDSIAALIGDDAVRLDYEPNLDPTATVIKPNSEYKWTVDMSTLCAKRLWYTGTFDAIQRRLGSAVFDSDAMIKLRSMMMDAGYEVACGICYVESTRREIGPITQEFINRYKEAQRTGDVIKRINDKGKAVQLTGKGRVEPFYPEAGYTPTMGDLNTTDIDLVKRDHPEVYKAYLAFMNARGQAKPKLLETRAEYKGEILKHFKAVNTVRSRNKHGGLRLQSFSDFEVPHMIDMMQIIMDMSRVGLKSQAYTKVPAFADIFGGTGVKINLSLIAKGTGLDADGNLIFDDVEGIPHEEAFRLRDKWSDNVGTILVGKSDEHIRAAMRDPRIDYIIPFHKSSWKESLYDALGLTGYDDYTATQNEKPFDPDREIKNFDPSEYWDFSKTGDENAEIYLAKCKADGRHPKFPRFAGEPGYWKLLIDFKMYNNDGVGVPQQIVKPDFDMEAARQVLADYKGGHQTLPVAKDIVEKFVQEYEGDVQKQRRTAPKMSDLEVLEMAAEGLEGLSLTEAESNSLSILRKKLSAIAPISEEIEIHEQNAAEYVESDPDFATAERNRATTLKAKRTRMESKILAGANGPIMRKVLQKARSLVESSERAEYREKIEKIRAEHRESERAKLAEYRVKRNESELAKRYKAKIEKDVRELITWVLKPDTKNALKHIPEGVKGPVMDFLEAIDFSSKRKLGGGPDTKKDINLAAKLQAVKAALDGGKHSMLSEDYKNVILSEAFFDRMDSLITEVTNMANRVSSMDAVVNEMSSEGLKNLSQVVKNLKKLIIDFNQFHKNTMFAHVYEAGAESTDFLRHMKPLKHQIKDLDWDLSRPAYIWERFGEGGKSIWNELVRAQADQAFHTKTIDEFANRTYTAKEVREWEKDVRTIKLSDDSEVQMTVAQIMAVYKLRERQQALGHLLGEGLRVPKTKGVKQVDEGHFLTEADLDAICAELNERQKAVADKLQRFMQDKGSEWGNQVTMVRFGEKLFGEPNYYPIHIDASEKSQTLDAPLKAQDLYALLNMGFTKQTQENASNRLVVYSIFDEFATHMANMATYNAYALPVVDAIKWFNYSEGTGQGVRSQLARVYGRAEGSGTSEGPAVAEQWILNQIKAINGTNNSNLKRAERLSNKLTSTYNRAQIAANLSVVIQQPFSVVRATSIISPASLAAGEIKKWRELGSVWKEMDQHSGIAVWKQMGFYDVNITRGLSEMIKHDKKITDTIADGTMKLAEWMDRWAWATLWQASKHEVEHKKGIKPTDDRYWAAVDALFNEIIYKTQVVDSSLAKAEFMTTKSAFLRPFTAFMSEPLTAVNLVTDAFYKFRVTASKEGKGAAWKKHGKSIARGIGVYAASALIQAMVTALRDAWRDDDDPKSFFEKWKEDLSGNLLDEVNPITKIPLLAQGWNSILVVLQENGWLNTDAYANSTAAQSLIDLANKLVKQHTEDTRYTTYGKIYNWLKALSGISGLPFANATREVVSVWNNTIGSMYPDMKLDTYDSSWSQEDERADLYTALSSGDAKMIQRIEAEVTDEDEYHAAIRRALRENDPRIQEAAEARVNGSIAEYDRLTRAILSENHFDETDIAGAIDAEVALLQPENPEDSEPKVKGRYKASDFAAMAKQGEWSLADTIIEEMVATKMANGSAKRDAEKNTRSGIISELKKSAMAGDLSKANAIQALTLVDDMDKDEAGDKYAEWMTELKHGYNQDEVKGAYLSGDITQAKAIEIRMEYTGKSRSETAAEVAKWEAEKSTGYAYDDIKEAFLDGELTSGEALAKYKAYGKTAAEAKDLVTKLEFQKKWPEADEISVSAVQDYQKYCAPAGVSGSIYYQVYEFNSKTHADVDKNGKAINGTKRKKVLKYIDSLQINTKQKDAIYYAFGWAKSTLDEAPWH